MDEFNYAGVRNQLNIPCSEPEFNVGDKVRITSDAAEYTGITHGIVEKRKLSRYTWMSCTGYGAEPTREPDTFEWDYIVHGIDFTENQLEPAA
jgi:hypothetical protein